MRLQKYIPHIVLTILLLGLSTLISQSLAQSNEGYWRLAELQIRGEDRDTREGARRAYMTGGPGSATYNTETDWGDRVLIFRATGQYTEPPQVLIPDKVINLPFSITRTQFRPPDWHWNPGATISVHDTRPHRDPDRRPFGKNYGAFVLSGMGDIASESDVAEISPPTYQGDGVAYYAITFSIGSSGAIRYFDYLYEWVLGAPTDEELAESEVTGILEPSSDTKNDEEPERGRTEAIITYTRGDVQARIDGVWQNVTTRTLLTGGSQVRTGEGSAAEVTFLGTFTLVRMRPGSTMDIPYRGEAEERSIIQLLLGRIWLRATRGVSFNVETSSAIAGVRGTDFGVEVDEYGGEAFICYSGEIEVTPFDNSGNPMSGRAIILGRGEKMIVTPNGDWNTKTLISETEQSVGIILGRPGFSDNTIFPQERSGRLFTDRESGDWRLQIYEQGNNTRHGLLLFEGSVVRDVAGNRLASPFGRLFYHGSFSESSNSGWLIMDEATTAIVTADQPLTGEDLGYSIVIPEGRRDAVHIMRNDELAWSLTQFMVFPEFEMVDQTGNGIPNVLIRYARGRSFRGFIFLELGPDGVNELWGFQVHASEAYEIEDEIERRRQQGESLERSPQRSRHVWLEEVPEMVRDEPHRNQHITLTADSYNRGEPIEIQWHNLPGNNTDWITVVPVDASERTWGNSWWYTEGARSGVRTVKLEDSGEYEIRVYFNWPDGFYEIQSRLRFRIM